MTVRERFAFDFSPTLRPFPPNALLPSLPKHIPHIQETMVSPACPSSRSQIQRSRGQILTRLCLPRLPSLTRRPTGRSDSQSPADCPTSTRPRPRLPSGRPLPRSRRPRSRTCPEPTTSDRSRAQTHPAAAALALGRSACARAICSSSTGAAGGLARGRRPVSCLSLFLADQTDHV